MKTTHNMQWIPSGLPRALRFGLAATALAALTACANYAGIKSEAQALDPAKLGLAFQDPASTGIRSAWWQGYGDGQLNGLVEQALANSPSLKLAQSRVARAQAVSEVAGAALLPQVNAQADVTRQLYTENGLYPAPLAGSIRNSGTLQLNGSWELDFFGKNRAALDAALGTAQAAEADAQAARVLLATQVVQTYFQLMRSQARLAVSERTEAQRGETLKLVHDRVSAGLDTNLELRQAESGQPEARVQIEEHKEQIALARNALAYLVGNPHAADNLVTPDLSVVQPFPLAGNISVDLLGRRADVAAARWRVEAATQDVASAKAQFYPNINLVGFVGLSSIGLGRLTEAGSEQWGIGPALRLPIFDAGRLRANLRGKTADLDAAVESYNNTVLAALRDVADQLASMDAIRRQQAEQVLAQQAGEGAYDISVLRYKAGLGTYLNVLTSEIIVLNQRRQKVDLQARLLDAQVRLVHALGGGYTAPALPAEQTAATKSAGLVN
ncbi:efflux transporter outer membrane subunit [Variovorax sp. HJSM1_2]|uniref:efflux transporter outer membrane subunit n=1 Tax=Variovorax sp. HJSM1_2 TaxID=3366263 RepID=UPI003BCA06D7